LERLEARFAPTSPGVIEVQIISAATGLFVDRILSTCADDARGSGQRTPWQQKANSGIDYDNANIVPNSHQVLPISILHFQPGGGAVLGGRSSESKRASKQVKMTRLWLSVIAYSLRSRWRRRLVVPKRIDKWSLEELTAAAPFLESLESLGK